MAEAYIEALFWCTNECEDHLPSIPLKIIAEIECQTFLNQLHYKVRNVVE